VGLTRLDPQSMHGAFSSRKIASKPHEDVAFRILAAVPCGGGQGNKPNGDLEIDFFWVPDRVRHHFHSRILYPEIVGPERPDRVSDSPRGPFLRGCPLTRGRVKLVGFRPKPDLLPHVSS
jgi:hypothetical protein